MGASNLILCGDSIEILPTFPENIVHAIVSDIPYGIGVDDWDVLHDNKNSALLGSSPAQKRAGSVFKRRGKPINGWSEADANIPKEYYEWCSRWAAEWLRVLKPGGTAFVFAGRRLAHRCIVAFEDAGFNFRDLIAWNRPKAAYRAQRLSVVLNRRSEITKAEEWGGWRLGNLRPTFEPILWFSKPYRNTVTDNVLEHQVGAYNIDAFERRFNTKNNSIECGLSIGEGNDHPNQKPVYLLEGLIELVTLRGQLVLDPFAGSGSTAVAARNLGRRYITIEKYPELCSVTKSRLRLLE